MEHTQNYQLSQWSGEDFIRMEDFNGDNEKIDKALARLERLGWSLAYYEAQMALQRCMEHNGAAQLGSMWMLTEPFMEKTGYTLSEGVTFGDKCLTLTGEKTGTASAAGWALANGNWTTARLFLQRSVGGDAGVEVWLNGEQMELIGNYRVALNSHRTSATMLEFSWSGQGKNFASIELKLTRGSSPTLTIYNYALIVA